LRKLSLQAYGILLDTGISLSKEDLERIRDSLSSTLKLVEGADQDEWELPFHALSLLLKLAGSRPETILDRKQSSLWLSVWPRLSHPNAWIQSTTASLCIQFFSHCVSADHSKLPLTCDYGLSMEATTLFGVLKACVRILRHTEGNPDVSIQAVQILGFLAQCFNRNGLSIEVQRKSIGIEDEGDSNDDSGEETVRIDNISGIQYLLNQLTRILRVEANRVTTAAYLSKTSSLQLLSNILPGLSTIHLPKAQIYEILLPLQHLADASTIQPRSADPTFAGTYQHLIELAHEVMETLQKKLGDTEYVKALTEVSKIMRKRREERRTKRIIERVAEPEKAARDKKRKHDRTKERKKEIGRAHQRRRKEVGM
jgi:U3 small nucleolar RNA-associated protein 20